MGLAGRFGIFRGAVTLLGVILGILILPTSTIDRWLLDERFLWRSEVPPVDTNLVVVALDQKYGERYNFPEITPRDYLDSLITVLTKEGARAIALDVIISTCDTTKAFRAFTEAVKRAPPVILPSSLEAYGLRSRRSPPEYELVLEPPSCLRPVSRSGYITFFEGPRPEMKVVTRLTEHTFRIGGASIVPSFALEAVAAFYAAGHSPDSTGTGPESHADSEDHLATLLATVGYPGTQSDRANGIAPGQRARRINYVGPVGPGFGIQYISSEDLLRAGILGPNVFRDKLVLIGAMHTGTSDVHDTPWGPMHGVELHANIINSLLGNTYLRAWDGPSYEGLLGLMAFLIVLVSLGAYLYVPPFWKSIALSLVVLLSFPAILFGMSFALFDRPEGLIFPMGLPLKVWLVSALVGFALITAKERAAEEESVEDTVQGPLQPHAAVHPASGGGDSGSAPVGSGTAAAPSRRWTYVFLGFLGGVLLAVLRPRGKKRKGRLD